MDLNVKNRLVPVIAVYDNLLGYKNISIEQNEAVAVRGFTNSLIHIMESGDYNAVSPADLSLYCLGHLDMDTGSIEVCEPRALAHGTHIITQWNINKCSCDNSTVPTPNEAKEKGEINGDN